MQQDKLQFTKIDEFIKKVKTDKKLTLVLTLAIVGVLLILFSPSTSDENDNTAYNDTTFIEYEQLEHRLESFVEKIKGAGECKVMITYECSEEKVYAKNTKHLAGEKSTESTQEYIIIDTGNKEEGLVEYTVYPKIRGVAIICSGADDPVVKQRIVSSVSALFSLSTYKISVNTMIR